MLEIRKSRNLEEGPHIVETQISEEVHRLAGSDISKVRGKGLWGQTQTPEWGGDALQAEPNSEQLAKQKYGL